MNDVKLGKFMSYALRHGATVLELPMDTQGWVDIDDLLKACQPSYGASRADIERVVATNDKKRYVMSEDGRRIRASQGHSLSVDLKLEPKLPPSILYHGTAKRFMEFIMNEGIKPMGRQHVHLSEAFATAVEVGKRHGNHEVLAVKTGRMLELGHKFYLSENEVWLTDYVPTNCFIIATY